MTVRIIEVQTAAENAFLFMKGKLNVEKPLRVRFNEPQRVSWWAGRLDIKFPSRWFLLSVSSRVFRQFLQAWPVFLQGIKTAFPEP